jgi:hypothetical protein
MLQYSDALILFIIFFIGSKIFAKFDLRITPQKSAAIIFILTGVILLIIAGMIYTLPSRTYLQGSGLPLIPALVGAVSLSCAAFFIFKRHPSEDECSFTKISWAAWVLYAVTWLLMGISKYAFLFSIYSPNIFKSDIQIPHVGIGLFIIGYFFAALSLYSFSRMVSIKLLWLFYFTIVYALYQVAVYTLLLVFGLIQQYNVSYPFLASIMAAGYVPFILALFITVFKNGKIAKKEITF